MLPSRSDRIYAGMPQPCQAPWRSYVLDRAVSFFFLRDQDPGPELGRRHEIDRELSTKRFRADESGALAATNLVEFRSIPTLESFEVSPRKKTLNSKSTLSLATF